MACRRSRSAFDIDANGILNVTAKDLGTGKEQKIEIKSGSGLSDEEVERMVKDAESHADDDRRLRELVEARNNAENAAYQAEKQLEELGDSVDAASKEEIAAAIEDVRDVARVRGRRARSTPRRRRCRRPSTRSRSRCTRAAAQQAGRGRRRRRRGGRRRRARTRKRSSTPRSSTETVSWTEENEAA